MKFELECEERSVLCEARSVEEAVRSAKIGVGCGV